MDQAFFIVRAKLGASASHIRSNDWEVRITLLSSGSNS